MISEGSVVAACLTADRPEDVARLLASIAVQRQPVQGIVLVDAGRIKSTPGLANVTHITSALNVGGAGGFALAILTALTMGAEWIWLMDDDACVVEDDCLAALKAAAQRLNLLVVSPLIVAPQDHARLSFPFRIGGRLSYDRARVARTEFIPGVAHFFSGALIHRDVFRTVGLPDMRLFVRGDETDFMLRLRRAKVPFGTITAAAVSHPPGWGEVVPIIRERLAVLVPETGFKRYYFFRNRGYLARRHRRLLSFLVDVCLYPYVFLILQRGNLAGLRQWSRAYWQGLTYRFGPEAGGPGKW